MATNPLLSLAVLGLALTLGFLPASGRSEEAPQAVSQSVPPPPPGIYDPHPGPFLIPTAPDGGVSPEGESILANANAAWLGHHLRAFTVCYWPGQEAVDWKHFFASVGSVARVLKSLGAQTVVMPAHRLCPTSASNRLADIRHVEVAGVIQL